MQNMLRYEIDRAKLVMNAIAACAALVEPNKAPPASDSPAYTNILHM